jgi:hypothetical protein
MTPAPPNDSIGRGVAIAVAWQVGAILLTIGTIWGLVQWVALIPLYFSQKRRGYRLAAKGLLIAGFVGLMLNASCLALLIVPLTRRR